MPSVLRQTVRQVRREEIFAWRWGAVAFFLMVVVGQIIENRTRDIYTGAVANRQWAIHHGTHAELAKELERIKAYIGMPQEEGSE